MSDAMSNAARYRAQRDAGEQPEPEPPAEAPMVLNAQNKSEFVETAIQLAIRQGVFDDLPGAGKPIEGLGTHHDPDWWIRRKIETENLSGLGPPALMLRVEDRGLDDELDRLGREEDVRSVLEDFNRRVIEHAASCSVVRRSSPRPATSMPRWRHGGSVAPSRGRSRMLRSRWMRSRDVVADGGGAPSDGRPAQPMTTS